MRELPAFVLLLGKNGSKLMPSAGEPGPRMRVGRGTLSGNKAPITMLTTVLANQLGRPVVDKTGLTGEYDFTLQWTPDAAPSTAVAPAATAPGAPPPIADGPSIFTAIQEQLGLRLDSKRELMDSLMVDNVEKPTEN